MAILSIKLKRDIGTAKSGSTLRVDKAALRASPLKPGVDYDIQGTLPTAVEPDPIPADPALAPESPAVTEPQP